MLNKTIIRLISRLTYRELKLLLYKTNKSINL